MDNLLLAGGIVAGLTYLHVNNHHKNMIKYKYNDRSYYVRKNPGHIMKNVAKVLYKCDIKIETLLKHLKNTINPDHKMYSKVQKMIKHYKRNLEELSYIYDNQTAYNINKGDIIGLCINKNNKLQNENIIVFVILHELAHGMTKEYSHNQDFWNNFKFLIKEALKINIYKYQNYNIHSTKYCDMKIDHTPYIQ